MASSSQSSSIQGIRDYARQEHWSKFDAIVRTLIAMDASPTDLEQRLRSVLDGNMQQGEETVRFRLDKGVEKLQPDTSPKCRPASEESGHNPTIKVEDDDEEPKHPIAKKTELRKRKATEDIGTMDCEGKRVVRSQSRTQLGSQQLDGFAARDPKTSPSVAPPDANRAPTPAAHIYRNEGGVFVRPKVGWQFHEFEGITKVWYNGKWRPLIQDQPSFRGVREAKGGWIVPMMAASKRASLEQRRMWERQGRVEFNSQF